MSTTLSTRAKPAVTPKPAFLKGIAMRAVHSRLERIEHGQLTIHDGDQMWRYGRRTERCPLSATIHVHDERFYGEIAFGGSIGAGEAYMLGYWTVNDLTALVRILLQNRAVLDGLETGLARLTEPVQKLLYRLQRNTRAGSRRNIAAHYDLGNDFFALFLDPSMMYSSAIFEHAGTTLADAQTARLDHICRKLDLQPQDHLLEIGTGWGGMAIHAARQYGCRVTTTTISREQFNLTCERVRDAGLADRITVLFEDYRDLEGRYDKLVSIEMIEAIGHEFYDTYFSRCARLLKPDGLMLLQAITIADQRYDTARRSVDFIQRHIFPGSALPSVAVLTASVARAGDMRLVHLEDIGPHYATTLRHWRDNFRRRREDVRALGYPEQFLRMWDYYLCYCEGGFEERAIGDVQMVLAKPDNRRAPIVPPLTH